MFRVLQLLHSKARIKSYNYINDNFSFNFASYSFSAFLAEVDVRLTMFDAVNYLRYLHILQRKVITPVGISVHALPSTTILCHMLKLTVLSEVLWSSVPIQIHC